MIQGAEHLQKDESQGPKGPGKGDAMPPLQGAEFQIVLFLNLSLNQNAEEGNSGLAWVSRSLLWPGVGKRVI